MADVFDLAKAFLSIDSMSNKKLQKLCYYAQAWHLALEDEALIDEDFQAWIHGPVCPELYFEYKLYGYEDIPKNETYSDYVPEEFLDYAKNVYEAYGELTGNELESISHSEDPWREARGSLKPWEGSNEIITKESMKRYYRKEVEDFE